MHRAHDIRAVARKQINSKFPNLLLQHLFLYLCVLSCTPLSLYIGCELWHLQWLLLDIGQIVIKLTVKVYSFCCCILFPVECTYQKHSGETGFSLQRLLQKHWWVDRSQEPERSGPLVWVREEVPWWIPCEVSEGGGWRGRGEREREGVSHCSLSPGFEMPPDRRIRWPRATRGLLTLLLEWPPM